MRIKLRQCVEILVERDAHIAVGVVVAPFAAGRGADFGAALDQLAAEFLELGDALGEFTELGRIDRADALLPFLDDIADAGR